MEAMESCVIRIQYALLCEKFQQVAPQKPMLSKSSEREVACEIPCPNNLVTKTHEANFD